MANKKILFSLIIGSILLVTMVHTAFHIAIFGSGISGLYESGISGFSIGKTQLGEEFRASHPSASPISAIIVGGEWALLAIFLIFTFVHNYMDSKHDIVTLNIKPVSQEEKTKTDIDLLYETLKDKKKLKLSTIARAFNIQKETASDWCKTLESSSLVSINTPRFGDPEVSIVE